MKIVSKTITLELSVDEMTHLFHICTYVQNDSSCGTLREDAKQLAAQLSSFDHNKLGV